MRERERERKKERKKEGEEQKYNENNENFPIIAFLSSSNKIVLLI
jgi:hypothetical protein